ncbi:protein-serine/threonine phosphatase [Ranunculus cassubicifolius]
MSLAADSPVSSSSSSDDFAALIDAELDAISSSSEEEELNNVEKEDDDDEEEEDFDIQSNKRRKVDELEDGEKEPIGSTSTSVADEQQLVIDTCRLEGHPAFIKGMCVRCGQYVEDESAGATAFGYIHKDLKIGNDEMARLRGSDLKNLLRNKKLYLVLDLDHTLLNSTRFMDISPEEEYIKTQVDSLKDIPKGSLFQLDMMHMMTKLRPFVRTFLKEASSMYEMYIYTMGEKAYALQMADLLDPERVYFPSKVVSQADCTQKHQKGLDVLLGADNAVVILDDTEFVWSKHKENLVLMERYHFFASSGRQFGYKFKSLSETKRDENEDEGALANILKVLKRVHELFFDLEPEVDIMSKDVRQVLKSVRKEVLKGCKLGFSRVWKTGEIAENQKLWEMAVTLGATCTSNYDSTVTHLVCTDSGTEKAKLALKDGKFLVHPRWVEAANYFWKRLPEDQFTVSCSSQKKQEKS